jgi:hypothetical protein
MRGRLMAGPALLRAVGLGALLVLILNPTRSRPAAGSTSPLVLLDASLSMAGTNGAWRAALDTARRAAAGGPIWRFGDRLTAFDTMPPGDGASRLAPALAAAAARGGPVIVVTDGAIDDAATLAPDLRRRPRLIVLSRPPFFDTFVAAVDAPRRVSARDTLRLRVTYGSAGVRSDGDSPRRGTLTVSSGGRRLETRDVPLPDSGSLTSQIFLPAARLPAGWSAIDVRIAASGDAEPRDDERRVAVQVSAQPTAVILAAPPGWEARFFARALAEVARVPVQLFDETEPGRWRDGATLSSVSADGVRRAVAGARVVALIGEPRRLGSFGMRPGVIVWPLGEGRAGDWYVDAPPASPLAGGLAGITWDSLPPATALADMPADSAGVVLLTARLARRGGPRPLAVLHDSTDGRRITIAGSGLWRWGFRGGPSAEAYRSLVAALANWLLGSAAPGADRVEPVAAEVANGLPLVWRWRARAAPRTLPIVLDGARGVRTDTLRFDALGQAELRVPPDAYRWRLPDGPEQGLVIVEEYSDEWRPAAPTLAAQTGASSARLVETSARDRWWWYWVAVAAFAGEWAWRRRRGLP